MSPLLRLAGCAAFAGLLLAATCVVRPAAFVNLGLDWWSVPDRLRQSDAEVERTDALTRRWQAAWWRTRTKDRICHALIAGQLTLAEATRQFMELPGTTEAMWQDIRTRYAGATPEASMGRHVIVWACDLLDREPAQAEALRRRLLAELEGR
jgi:hypothetical protein